MRLLLFLSISLSLVGMQKELTYPFLCKSLKENGLVAMREIAQSSDQINKKKIHRLVVSLSVKPEDLDFIVSCVAGKLAGAPSTVMVRDLGVYLAALCSYDDLASELFRAENNPYAPLRMAGFLKKLFCLAVVKDCSKLTQRILKGMALTLGNKHQVTDVFLTLAPVFFYKNDRAYFMSMCDLLGKMYLDEKCQRLLLAAFDNNVDRLRELGFYDYQKRSVMCESLLTGFAIREGQHLEIFKMVWKAWQGVNGKRRSVFYALIIKKAREIGNDTIVAYLSSDDETAEEVNSP